MDVADNRVLPQVQNLHSVPEAFMGKQQHFLFPVRTAGTEAPFQKIQKACADLRRDSVSYPDSFFLLRYYSFSIKKTLFFYTIIYYTIIMRRPDPAGNLFAFIAFADTAEPAFKRSVICIRQFRGDRRYRCCKAAAILIRKLWASRRFRQLKTGMLMHCSASF